MKQKILDFGKGGAVKLSSIQYMSGFDSPNVTHIGFIDGTEADFAVNPQNAFGMWHDVRPSVFVLDEAAYVFSGIAAIQLFPKGHKDSPFKKKEAVIRIWFDHCELFLPTARYHPDPEVCLRQFIDTWKVGKT
jgi:hypothetical protein